jgi:hypothetical protein
MRNFFGVRIRSRQTNRSGDMEPTSRRDPIGRKAVMFALLGACILASACSHDQTTWSAEAKSQDGKWVAKARKVENGGFGTGSTETLVYLEPTTNAKASQLIVAFSHDVSSSAHGGTINLVMKWINSSHLDLVFDGHAKIDFQVAKYGVVEISVRDTSSVDVLSPDGHWFASGRIARSFGAGTPCEQTDVYLKRSEDASLPEKVLALCHDAAASRAGTVHLGMKWLTPLHLDVTYDGHAHVDFVAPKYSGIEISVRAVSGE